MFTNYRSLSFKTIAYLINVILVVVVTSLKRDPCVFLNNDEPKCQLVGVNIGRRNEKTWDKGCASSVGKVPMQSASEML